VTTIAYRDGVLAADTQITAGGGVSGHVQKAFRKGSILYSTTGCSGLGDAFLTWVAGGLKGDPPVMKEDDNDAHGYIFPGGDRVVWRFNKVWATHHAPFFAFGSGADYALGAMEMGATAEQAVAAAIKFDTNSGGPITVLRRL
jgi:ATP-dependent HslUV protease subunit HslV